MKDSPVLSRPAHCRPGDGYGAIKMELSFFWKVRSERNTVEPPWTRAVGNSGAEPGSWPGGAAYGSGRHGSEVAT